MIKINRSVARIFRFLIGAKDLEGQSIFSDLSRLTNLRKFRHFVKQINFLLFAITHVVEFKYTSLNTITACNYFTLIR